jgi:hypothetical protein
MDIWPRRIPHAFTQEKAWMRGFVVGDILPRDAQSILRVVHQRDNAVQRGLPLCDIAKEKPDWLRRIIAKSPSPW